jgi:hypothetical protein
MEPASKALNKISKQINAIRESTKDYNQEMKNRIKYKKTCMYCQKYLTGRKDTKDGEVMIDLEKNGEGYCKLCESKFCNQYPNEEICNQISKIKENKMVSEFSKLSLQKTSVKTRDPNCMKCLEKGQRFKKEGKLTKEEDDELRQSCLSCKKSTCLKDKILDEDDENFCTLINDIIEYYISYKKSS